MPELYLDILGISLQFIGWAFFPIILLPALNLLSGRFSPFSSALVTIIDDLNTFIGEVVKWVMPLMVISIVMAVIALSIYGVSSIWWDETAIYLHAIGICLGVAPTYLAGQHVKVDIFYDKMPYQTKALVEICGFYALVVPVSIAVIWFSQSFVAYAWQSLEGSTNSGGIQGLYLLKTGLSVMFLLLLMQGLSVATRAAILLKTSQSLPLPKQDSIHFIEKSVHKSDAL